jgi:hypothetical protein
LQDKSEITVYSVEYGLTLKNLAAERDKLHINYSVFDQDINSKFINKKRIKDKRKKLGTSLTNEKADNLEDDEDFINPNAGLQNNEDSDRGTKDKNNAVPNRVSQKKDIVRSSKQESLPTNQLPLKKREHEIPTRGPTQIRKDKKTISHKQYNTESDDGDNRIDYDLKKNNKVHGRDENGNDSSGHEVEDIPYPIKTNQPLEKRIVDTKKSK